MTRLTRQEVAAVLEEMAVLLELKGENPFRCRAYANGARALEGLEDDLAGRVADGTLDQVPGIGKGLAALVSDLVRTGSSADHEALAASVPEGVRAMTRLRGLGPRRVRAIWKDLGVSTVGELEYACNENRLLALKGFGARTQAQVLKAIAVERSREGLFLYPHAEAVARSALEALRAIPGVERAEVAGALRRGAPVIGRVLLLAAAPEGLHEAVGAQALRLAESGAPPVELRLVAPGDWAAALVWATGDEGHLAGLQERAARRGLVLGGEAGLTRRGRPVACAGEEEVYGALGLAPLPPELREGTWALEAAGRGEAPRLVEEGDLEGLLHVHTDWSDGADTLEAMAARAAAMGARYLGLSDHSASAVYAGGLGPERVRAQAEEVRRVRQLHPGLRIFHGIEADILGDGGIDYDEGLWRGLDFIIASVHSRFSLSREEQTRRVIAAMENPHVTMVGHLTGRLLLAREPYALDVDAVLQAAARLGVAVELNAHPRRLDLDEAWGPRARELGVKVSINPDAHSTEGLEDVRHGVRAARRAGFRTEDVVNTLGPEAFEAWLRRRR